MTLVKDNKELTKILFTKRKDPERVIDIKMNS